jgi:hypothetical protein
MLVPREHGAYAELGFPLASGLLLGAPGAPSWLFAAGAIVLFVANEPLMVLTGARGKRLREEMGSRARWQLALLAGAGGVMWLAALAMAEPGARSLAFVPATLALLLLPMAMGRELKTLGGEFLAAAAFSTMHLPVAAAGGVGGAMLWGPALMCFVTTVVATLSVHAVKARVTGKSPWLIAAAQACAVIALVAAAALAPLVPEIRYVALAAQAPLAACVAVNALAPSPKKLKPIGWTLAAANTIALAILVLGPSSG